MRYSRYRPYALPRSAPTRATPELERLDRLSLHDLRKIKKFVEKYRENVAATAAENLRIEAENRKRKLDNERSSSAEQQRLDAWERDSGWSRAVQRMQQLRDLLWKLRVGVIGGVFQPTVRFDGFDVPTNPGLKFVKEYQELDRKVDLLWRSRPEPSSRRQPLLPSKKEPLPHALMTISGAKVRVSASRVELTDLEARIVELEGLAAREKEKELQLRARIADKESETRRLAKRYRSAVIDQLSKLGCCPYCSGDLSPETAHQDHIHPVCKGGHSVPRNLVFVCSICNMKKSDTTLGIFLRSSGFSVSDVHARLELLGKDF